MAHDLRQLAGSELAASTRAVAELRQACCAVVTHRAPLIAVGTEQATAGLLSACRHGATRGTMIGHMTDAKVLEPDSKLQRQLEEHAYKVLAASAVLLIAVGTVVFSLLEDWSIVDSFYFSVVTATTVGFGDLTPDTDGAKLFTVLYIIFGISIIGTFLNLRFKRRSIMRVQSHSDGGADNPAESG